MPDDALLAGQRSADAPRQAPGENKSTFRGQTGGNASAAIDRLRDAVGTLQRPGSANARPPLVVVMKGYPRLSETFIAQELHALQEAGIDLRIVALRHPHDRDIHPIHREITAPVFYLPEYLHNEPLRVLRAALHCAGNERGFWRTLRMFWADLRRDFTVNRVRRLGQAFVLVREHGHDAAWFYVHFLHTPAAVVRYASALTGNGWSCSAHAKDIYTSPDWDLREKLDDMAWLATCTRANVAHLRALSQAHADKINLVYHGIDVARLDAVACCNASGVRNGPQSERAIEPERATEPERASEPVHSSVRLLSVGRLVEKKGYGDLLTALARLPADIDWRLTHIGGGELKSAMAARAAELGLGGRITWLGAQPQGAVLAAYRTHDIFILASRIADDGDRDGLPNVLMEAQSQGLACISTTVSAIPELITDRETGLLVPPEAPAALAEAIEALARAPALRQSLSQAGRDRVRLRFAHTEGVRQLLSLFDGAPGLSAIMTSSNARDPRHCGEADGAPRGTDDAPAAAPVAQAAE